MSRPRFLRTAFALTVIAMVAATHGWRKAGHPDPRGDSCIYCTVPRASIPPSARRVDTVVSPVVASPAAVPAVLDEPLQAFASWTTRYVAAGTDDKQRLEPQGVKLAKVRRPVMKDLIREDPRRALENAVPMVVRQKLPPTVLAELEQRFNERAAVTVYMGVPPSGVAAPPPGRTLTHRIAQIAAKGAYNLHVYGRREQILMSTPNAAINGIGIDRDIAASDEPMRVLEVGEVPDPAKRNVTVCPISGKVTATTAEAGQAVTAAQAETVVETPEEIVHLCGGYHRPIYSEQLVYGEGSTGGPTTITGPLPAAPTPALGQLKVLYIPLTFQDQNAIPATESKCYEVMRDVADYYLKSSFGKLTTLTTVTPPVKLPKNEAWYVQRDSSNGGDVDGLGLEMAHAREEARRLGFDYNAYDVTVVRLNGGARPTGGWGGGGNVWIYGDSVGVCAHEIGHSFGLAHANFWDTSGTSAIGPGANAEYGDSYDVMGGGGVPGDHYNAAAKSQIKWLPDTFVQNVTASGLYRIYAFDQGALDPRNRYAMTITKDSQRTYWGELRQNYTGSSSRQWADKGMILGWKFPAGSGGNIQLLDTTPGSPYGKDDAAVTLGQTFSDTEAGIYITTVGISSTTPKYVDVVVNMGDFSGNHEPTLEIAASAETVPTGATVTFTASASDEDGDTLAYQWQHWGDTSVKLVSPNSPVITRTFPTAGSYVVSCTVSDMKGGSVTREKLVVVGNGNSRFTIRGRVTLSGVGLPGVLLNANGTNPVITDQDGYYTISNLVANNYSVTPLLYGFSFSELFNNSITVGPSFGGADFEAAALPAVAISTPDALATENNAGDKALIRLTRTGDTTQPLTVNVTTASGSASSGDYTLAPALTTGSPFNSFTIPADSATLDIVLATVNDGAAEGPETLILSTVAGSGYLVAPNAGSATVTINDDDTALPQVAVRATTDATVENSGVPGVFLLSRTGSTASALSINVTLSGTAAQGADFTAIASPVTIPANASSVIVNVTSLDDALVESVETVKMTVGTSLDYVISPLATTAVINVIDDDTPTVTIAATDANAREVDLSVPANVADTGTFVVTRTGDTSQPLTVYYALAGTTVAGAVPALHGVDFEALPGVLLIPAGSTSASVTVIPRWDGLGETAEQVVLQLGAGPTNYLVGANATATVTINDGVGNVPYVEVDNISVAAEPATTGKFRFSLKGSAAGNIPVKFSLVGSAERSVDYTVTLPTSPAGSSYDPVTGTGTVMIAGTGTNTVDLSIVPVNDAVAEEIETVVCSLTSDAAYQSFGPTASATLWLRDDEQPTVWADVQVGTGGAVTNTLTEGSATSPVKFYVSRTGATTAALAVNFSLGGNATPGADFNVTTSASLTFDNVTRTGVLTIPAGAAGADVPVAVINDTDIEGTETVLFQTLSGAYSRTVDASLLIADNEVNPRSVAFDTTGASGSEGVSSIAIPVSLDVPASVATTVEYVVDTGSRNSTSATTTQPSLPYWVRAVRNGSSFSSYYSTDGVIWNQRGTTQTIVMSSSSYLMGVLAASASAGTGCTATIDNVSITGLEGTGSVGTLSHATIGTSNPVSTSSDVAGVYTLNAGGTDLAASGTGGDVCRYVSFPVSNSITATITARIVSLTSGVAASKAGVMIRETTAATSRHLSSLVQRQGTSQSIYRSVGTAASTTGTSLRPYWVQLRRTGNVFSGWMSADGATWTQLGADQTLPLGQALLAGLAVSARNDGLLATAAFDNVSLVTTASQPLTFVGRTIGYVNAQGEDSFAAGTCTVSGSGAQIGGSEDECHFAAMPVTGNFTMTARVLSQSGGAANSQAGLMVRDVDSYRSRSVYAGLVANAMGELQVRNGTVTSAFGNGIDYTLPSGSLTFNVGESTKNIVLNVRDDALLEQDETVTIVLRNPNGAQLGARSVHTYTIEDNDEATVLPGVQFAASASSVAENAGTAALQVSLGSLSATPVSVDYSVSGGTAAGAGSDFTLDAGTLTFAPGELVKPITLAITDDSIQELSETVVVTLAPPVGGVLSSQGTHTLTITDNDLPVVTVVASDPSAAETGADRGEFTFTRTGPSTSALTINYAVSGSSVAPGDRNDLGTSITIAAGASTATLQVTPVDDATNEGTETAIITIASNSAYVIGASGAATVSIADNDRSTVTVTASDATGSETAGNPGAFTITRTAPSTGTLSVAFTVTGTASSGSDFTSLGTSVSFAANETSKTITVSPVNDAVIEGDELVVLSLSAGSYDIGSSSFATVTILDNDIPPTVYVTSPTANGPLIANGNGLLVSASVTDDGTPQPVTVNWTQSSGPGTAVFETPSQTTSAVTFSASGVYVLRVTATDSQFTVSDQVTVVVGNAFAPADWIAQDMSPTTQQRGQSSQTGTSYILTGMGAGYAATTSDAAHIMARQVSGDGAIVARLTATTGPATAPLGGVTIRDSLARSCKRAVLGYVPGSGLQFRARTTASANDTVVTQAGITLPVWIRLSLTGDSLQASYASDVAGSPGTWTNLGSATTMGLVNNITQMGLTATGNSSTAGQLCTVTFDNVSLTPVPTGPALVSEDLGTTTPTASTFSESNGTYTLGGSGGLDGQGAFYGWQYYGDVMVTAKETAASSGALNAHSGIMIRESMDSTAGYVHLGRCPTGSFSGYFWRSLASGGTGGVPSFTGAVRWMRLIRQGNRVTAYHAADVSGSPGTWAQLGQPQTIIMSTPVLVGLAVDNNGGTAGVLNVASFNNLSIVPLNKAPVVSIASVLSPVISSVALNGSVSDDSFPAPPSLASQWSVLSSPGINLASLLSPATTATITGDGLHALRLTADDGSALSFKDLSFTGYVTSFSAWQSSTFASSNESSAAPDADPDRDGLPNLLEYAVNTAGGAANPSPVIQELMPVGQQKYLCVTVPKNPAATDVTFTVEATSNILDPLSWSSAGVIITQNTGTVLQARDSVAVSGATQRFMRVRVTRS